MYSLVLPPALNPQPSERKLWKEVLVIQTFLNVKGRMEDYE